MTSLCCECLFHAAILTLCRSERIRTCSTTAETLVQTFPSSPVCWRPIQFLVTVPNTFVLGILE